MKRILAMALAAGLLAPSGAVLGRDAAEGRATPLSHLDRAERHLLAALHVIRGHPPGPLRDAALDQARQALVETQSARGLVVGASGSATPDRNDRQRVARALLLALSRARDVAADGDRARIGYAIDRAEHALSMARLNPLEREVVDGWLDEAKAALDRGRRRLVRRALEQAEWTFRGLDQAG